MCDAGLLLDLLAPLSPRFFLLCLVVGNIMKALAGVAGGATRVSMTQHFAAENNLADLSAKAGSQEQLCSFLGIEL